MTDTDKITNGPARLVEVPVVKDPESAADLAKSADEHNEKAAREAFDATQKPVGTDASVSAADGSTSSVAGS